MMPKNNQPFVRKFIVLVYVHTNGKHEKMLFYLALRIGLIRLNYISTI